MPSPVSLVEFPADDTDRARRFWSRLLDIELKDRDPCEGRGWQTRSGDTELGVHPRGPGPGDTVSLPYFSVADLARALEHVVELGGSVIHSADGWAVCRGSEGSPFGLSASPSVSSEAGT